MRVKLNKAVKLFFGNSSLEMVYFEAIANSLDAGANKIDITISAKDFSQTDTLIIEIEDNGLGFTDDRFVKFSNLLMWKNPHTRDWGDWFICVILKMLL